MTYPKTLLITFITAVAALLIAAATFGTATASAWVSQSDTRAVSIVAAQQHNKAEYGRLPNDPVGYFLARFSDNLTRGCTVAKMDVPWSPDYWFKMWGDVRLKPNTGVYYRNTSGDGRTVGDTIGAGDFTFTVTDYRKYTDFRPAAC